MSFLFIVVGLLSLSALLSFFSKERKREISCGGVLIASALGLAFSLQALMRNASSSVKWGTPLPDLTLAIGIDALSAFFLVAIFGLSLLTSLYAWGYLKNQRSLLATLPFFPLLIAAMVLVVVAQDGFFFLICWEIMSLTSFFLVATQHELREVRHAGWIYLITTHLATVFLVVFFVILQEKAGSFLFEDWSAIASLSSPLAGALFLLALIGFGTKAGIFPFHVWLPHAHPAAPSYISALMSGVMIKMGSYGLLRATGFLGPPPLWWGATLLILGLLSALLGILYASIQGDLKRALAYSSVENIGIIFVGMGLGLVGLNLKEPMLIYLGLGGALFHTWNHGLFKTLLFLGAGSVVHATHTRLMEQLGGLLKQMPVTGIAFLVGSAAICGLPPLNGFISELLIYVGLFHGAQGMEGFPLFLVVFAIVGIAFAGGLAIACFTKIFGIVFLGKPRQSHEEIAQDPPLTMRISLIVLSGLCLLCGLFPHLVWTLIAQPILLIAPSLQNALPIKNVMASLIPVAQTSLLLLALVIALWLLRQFYYRDKDIQHSVTWDCGYAHPTPRMQYTASSFAQPMAVFFRFLFRPFLQFKKPNGIFPGPASFTVHIADLAEKNFFEPLFRQGDSLFKVIRKIQRGSIQNYLTLIFFTLIVLFLWEVWFGI